MINKMDELHDIAIKAIFAYAEKIVPTDLDQDEAQAVIRDELCRPVQLPPLSVVQTDQASSVFKKAESALAGLFSRLSFSPKTSCAEKADAIAKTIAAEIKGCAACRAPFLSFAIVMKPPAAYYNRERKKQERAFRNWEIDPADVARCREYDKLMRDKAMLGVEIAKGVHMRVNSDWIGVDWKWSRYMQVSLTCIAMYTIIVSEGNKASTSRFLDELRNRLEEMGYTVEHLYGEPGSFHVFHYRIVWIDKEEWERIIIAAADQYAIEAWNAGVPLDDIVI